MPSAMAAHEGDRLGHRRLPAPTVQGALETAWRCAASSLGRLWCMRIAAASTPRRSSRGSPESATWPARLAVQGCVGATPSNLATLKAEFYDRYLWPTKAAAKLAVGDWIERVCNRAGAIHRGVYLPRRVREPTHSDGTSRLTVCPPNGVKPSRAVSGSERRGTSLCVSPPTY